MLKFLVLKNIKKIVLKNTKKVVLKNFSVKKRWGSGIAFDWIYAYEFSSWAAAAVRLRRPLAT